MSLKVSDKGGGRSRSRSRDRRTTEEASRDVVKFADVEEPRYTYPDDDDDDRYKSSRRGDQPKGGGGLPYPSSGDMDNMLPGTRSLYSYDDTRPIYRTASPGVSSPYRSSRDKVDSQLPGTFPEDDRRRENYDYDPRSRHADPDESKYSSSKKYKHDDDPRSQHAEPEESKYSSSKKYKYEDDHRSQYADPDESKYSASRKYKHDDDPRSRHADPEESKYSSSKKYKDDDDDDRRYRSDKKPSRYSLEKTELDTEKLKFLPGKYSKTYEEEDSVRISERSDDKTRDRRRREDRYEEDLTYGKVSPTSPRAEERRTYGSYLPGAQSEDKRASTYPRESKDDGRDRRRASSPDDEYSSRRHQRDSYRDDPRASAPSVLTADPSSRDRDRPRDRRRDASPGPLALIADPERREKGGSIRRDRSPQPPTARMSSLTVDSGRSSHGALSIAQAPPSPLLESYRGTYQDCSPMPSPLLMASADPSDDPRGVEILSASPDLDGDGKKRNRRARFHDPEDIASRLARALKGDKAPDTEPLIEILPSLTHEQVLELRDEYKSLVKTGSDRKGVNIAKHIRSRLKDEDPNLMKACYSVALGIWEGEAYWANFWYQGDKTRRELLIESLMGRTNAEVHLIKEAFKDKKYDNSLTKCMKTELKEDKFKKAVLIVLEERRMEEHDRSGRALPLDYELVDKDVSDLRKAVKAEKGGESNMISIVIQRSDSHLRCVLKEYERHYHHNFAREALKKSGNLVVSNNQPAPLPPLLFSLVRRVANTNSPPPFPGRAPRTHPQRRHQPAGPRRPAAAPRRVVVEEGQPAPRAAHLAPRALPLGRRAHAGRQEGVPRALWPRPAGCRARGVERQMGPVLRGAVHCAHARRCAPHGQGRDYSLRTARRG